LTSTSCSQLAQEVLARALAGEPVEDLPRALLEDACSPALFTILAEGLADRFEPALCEMYARLFTQAIAAAVPVYDAHDLLARYQRVRRPYPVSTDPKTVVVLSRVTLGADIAVTSVLLDAAKRRFPDAEIVFAGPQKNAELFAADLRIRHARVEYRRGTLKERLQAAEELRALCDASGTITIDCDSRLTQLGLLPVCPEDRYHLFESRAYGGDSGDSLPKLAASWAHETLGVVDAMPYIAPRPGSAPAPPADSIAVSFGVGENPSKRLPDPFEEQLLAVLARHGSVCIDKGAGGEESARVERAVLRSGIRATFWEGSFAGFARIISSSSLYVGYDSAGQHAAAAAGVPLISIFAGYPSERMFDRWRPSGPHATVVKAGGKTPDQILEQIDHALAALALKAR
jgi:ADP-heptose:LPS heptosyltransferase